MEQADNNDSVPYFVVWSVFETERNRGLATVEKPVDEDSVVVYEKNVSMNEVSIPVMTTVFAILVIRFISNSSGA